MRRRADWNSSWYEGEDLERSLDASVDSELLTRINTDTSKKKNKDKHIWGRGIQKENEG
jgi:phage-related minor tail protein